MTKLNGTNFKGIKVFKSAENKGGFIYNRIGCQSPYLKGWREGIVCWRDAIQYSLETRNERELPSEQ